MTFPIEIMKMIQPPAGASYPLSVSTTMPGAFVDSNVYQDMPTAAAMIVTADATGKIQAHTRLTYDAVGSGTGTPGASALSCKVVYRLAGTSDAFTDGPIVSGNGAGVDINGISTGGKLLNYVTTLSLTANTSYEVKFQLAMSLNVNIDHLNVAASSLYPEVYTGNRKDTLLATPAYASKTATPAAATAATTVAWPATHSAGQLGLLVVQTANQSISTPAGWTLIAQPSTGTAAASGATRTIVFRKFAASSAEAAVSITDSGDHQNAIILTFNNVDATNPVEQLLDPSNTSTAAAQSAATGGSAISPNTYGANRLLVAISGVGLPDANGTANWSSWNLTGVGAMTERHDQTWTTGVGGGIGVADIALSDPGMFGAVTYTNAASSAKGNVILALNPS